MVTGRGMPKRLFSPNSVNAFYEAIITAERRWGLNIKGGPHFDSLKTHKMTWDKALSIFNHHWQQVDWTNRESILTMLPYIERAYALVPRSQFSFHHELDTFLKNDGYRIRDGKMRKLLQKPSHI